MKRLVLAITLASLAALPHVGAAAPRARQCPTLSVSCPDTIGAGSPMTFTVMVSGGPADLKLTYNWVVSAGTISSGQGTSSIIVDMTGLYNGFVTATVEVGGLPESCPESAACTVTLPQGCYLDKLDEYGNIKFVDEKARLDNYIIELRNDPTAQGYLICYGGRRGYADEAVRRCERAKGYLSGVRGIAPGRLVIVDGGFREELTVKIVVVPAGATPPAPSPTVDPREVVIINRGARRR